MRLSSLLAGRHSEVICDSEPAGWNWNDQAPDIGGLVSSDAQHVLESLTPGLPDNSTYVPCSRMGHAAGTGRRITGSMHPSHFHTHKTAESAFLLNLKLCNALTHGQVLQLLWYQHNDEADLRAAPTLEANAQCLISTRGKSSSISLLFEFAMSPPLTTG